MDDEKLTSLLQGFAEDLKSHVDEQVKTSKLEISNLVLSTQQEASKELAYQRSLVTSLWRSVKGSDPPPPNDGSSPPPADSGNGIPLDDIANGAFAKASAHDLDIHALRGQLIASERNVVAMVQSEIQKVLAVNGEQSKALGIGAKGGEFLGWIAGTRAGQRWVLSAFAAATSLVTAVGTLYALVTGRLPLP